MFIFFLIFVAFYCLYYYLSYQVILLNDLEQIFSQTASKAQVDLKQYSELALQDLGNCYQHVLLLILLTTALTFAWILLLKYNAKIIVWLSLFSLPILISVGLYFSIRTYINLHDGENEIFNTDEQNLAFDKAIQTVLAAELASYLHSETLWLVISITLFLLFLLLFIILHSLKDRVSISIALIGQASKAINAVKSTLLFPIFPRALGISALIHGVLIALLIISASHPQSHIVGGPNHGKPCIPKSFRANMTIPVNSESNLSPPNRHLNNSLTASIKCETIQHLSRQHIWKYHALNLFATLWLIHFISGVSQTTLAGAFASYYWAYRKPHDVPYFAVTASFFRTVAHHLGDIAFGSFLIATIRYIRIVIEFIDHRLRSKREIGVSSAIPTARSCACFFRIFFWLLERFLKYIDRNAYIMMSMYGDGYLKSARRAVELLYQNSTRALVLDYVTYFVLLISRILITVIAGYIAAQEMFTANLNYKWLPIVLVVLGTYFISKGLFSVYSMAVDTLFICFLIDSSQNDGSAGRPYFMSKELRRIMKRNTVMT